VVGEIKELPLNQTRFGLAEEPIKIYSQFLHSTYLEEEI
jgi:hypothetical protein